MTNLFYIRRAFNCDSKKVKSKSFTPPPRDTVCNHHCSTCIDYTKLASIANVDAVECLANTAAATDTPPTTTITNANDRKLLKIQIKKPLLKSIVLSANKSSRASAISSGISFGKIKQEIIDTNHSDERLSPAPISITNPNQNQTADPTTDTMQFSNPKKTNKQINSYFIRTSYSPPLPATHRLASMVSSECTASANNSNNSNNSNNNNNNDNNGNRRSSRDRKKLSSEKRKKARGSRSQTR